MYKDIKFKEPIEVKQFKTKRTLADILSFGAYIKKTYKEMLKFAELTGLNGQQERKATILQSLIEQQNKHPDPDTVPARNGTAGLVSPATYPDPSGKVSARPPPSAASRERDAQPPPPLKRWRKPIFVPSLLPSFLPSLQRGENVRAAGAAREGRPQH
jgi:hypothetical protein